MFDSTLVALDRHVLCCRRPIPLDGWHVDVGYPEGRDEAEARLNGEFEAVVEAAGD